MSRRRCAIPEWRSSIRIPRSLVKIVSLHPSVAENGALKVGDLVLAVEVKFRVDAGVTESLKEFHAVEDVAQHFNDRRYSDNAGMKFSCWVYRDGKVEVVELTAKRLLY